MSSVLSYRVLCGDHSGQACTRGRTTAKALMDLLVFMNHPWYLTSDGAVITFYVERWSQSDLALSYQEVPGLTYRLVGRNDA